ncbi:glycoside hydrolase family 18 protein [Mixia osmundae IAM 14324]|uniref:GH18 domain-containing protein n=1 Tax=Mixia osmundae (strain CBS 9802 / IAM 14324 / JCM 22182 / KY 12970) TaxID=764103 RepID=G7DUP0_MIXOS|nr:glycoside hydrolase family 18 protein [Mixia osmundae IAM 14324]KEI37485.1 glycoside hydrolase family 18 protein [Mixia osmundae IAM 14324]GAA94300.1 hypothetical protein E5Q_00949 [Mixia osmundae IAM 14324]
MLSTPLLLLSGLSLLIHVQAAVTGQPYVGAYYAGYSSLSPTDIPYSSLTNINFFVATTTIDGGLSFSSTTDATIKATVEGAKSTDTSVSLTLGGWTGSAYFSYDVGSSANRTAFAKLVSSTVTRYGFSGVDIDCALGQKPIISLAVSVGGLRDSAGTSLSTYTNFLSSVDYLMIMNYDIWGPYGQGLSGPNAPLYTCSSQSSGNPYSASEAVSYFQEAGWPASRLILGVPSYSHSFSTTSASLSTTTCGSAQSQLYQAGPASDTAPAGAIDQTTFAGLIADGYLNSAGTAGAGGFVRLFDTSSSTPFLFSSSQKILISYDDAQSMSLKGAFAKQHGLAGVSMFELSGDTADHMLLNAYRSGFLTGSAMMATSTAGVTTATATSNGASTTAHASSTLSTSASVKTTPTQSTSSTILTVDSIRTFTSSLSSNFAYTVMTTTGKVSSTSTATASAVTVATTSSIRMTTKLSTLSTATATAKPTTTSTVLKSNSTSKTSAQAGKTTAKPVKPTKKASKPTKKSKPKKSKTKKVTPKKVAKKTSKRKASMRLQSRHLDPRGDPASHHRRSAMRAHLSHVNDHHMGFPAQRRHHEQFIVS